MTHIDAMKLALEALNRINRDSVSREHAQLVSEEAITVLRQAIEQAEQAQPVAWYDPKVMDEDRGISWTPGQFHTAPLYTAPPRQNDFNPDWDAMAVMVQEQQGMAAEIERLKDALNKSESRLHEVAVHCEQVEPWGWRWKERINGELDNWVVTFCEPPPYAIEKQPLYTAPPQRKPLTHPQIHELDWPDGVAFEDILLFARAIEAKLMEKNG